MFGYSMIQMIRTHAGKLERPLREEILNLYRPFKWTPCILHRFFEGIIKRRRKFSIIIEFENGCYDVGFKEVNGIMSEHKKNKVKHHFSRISCCSAEVTPNGLEEILSSCNHIKKVYMNREVKAFLDVAVDAAKAKNIAIERDNKVLTGNGVKIAIVDTGIYPHRDLSGRITDFIDFVNNRTDPYDDNGHGTHCAGDAAGDGSASSSRYAGPAPKASLVGIKVLDKIGSGSLDTVMLGVDWCIEYNERNSSNKIDIISMSLGSSSQSFTNENDDPMVRMVEEAWNSGIVVCVAAGNDGPERKTIASPGISNQVITVGALDDKNIAEPRSEHDVAEFSSRGPTPYGVTKPDILAPGVNIISLRSPNSYLDKLQKANRVENDYFVLSGTSMATPICAGIVALMKEYNPSLKPDDIKKRIMAGADLWEDKDSNVYGAGYINAERAISLD